MKLLKQYNIPVLGGFMDSVSQSMLWVGALNALLNIPTAYQIWLKNLFPQISLPLFILFIFAGIVLIMLLGYKFLMRSYYEWARKQDGTKKMLRALCEKSGIDPDNIP